MYIFVGVDFNYNNQWNKFTPIMDMLCVQCIAVTKYIFDVDCWIKLTQNEVNKI